MASTGRAAARVDSQVDGKHAGIVEVGIVEVGIEDVARRVLEQAPILGDISRDAVVLHEFP